MNIKSFVPFSALLGLAACGGGSGGAFVDPVDSDTMQAAIEMHFDGTCEERESTVFACGAYGVEPILSGLRPEIGFTLLPVDDDTLGVANLFLDDSYLEEGDVLSMLNRFGFSESDYLEINEPWASVDRGDFRLQRLSVQHVVVISKPLTNLD
jgi:hypothetical protein